MDLRVNLHPAVLRNHLIGDRYPFMNRNPLLHYSVMLHAVTGVSVFGLECRAPGEPYLDMLSILSILVMPSQCRICAPSKRCGQ